METIANITGHLGKNCELMARTDKMSKYRFVLIIEEGQEKDAQGMMAVACQIWVANGVYWPFRLRGSTRVSVTGKLRYLVAGMGIHNSGLGYMETMGVAFL